LPFILSPLLALVMNRWGSGMTMAVGSVFMAVWAMSILLLPSVWGGAVSLILFYLSVHFTATARGLFGQQSVLPRWRTLVNAVLTISMAGGGSLVGFLGGRVIDAAGFRPLFMGSVVLSLASAALYASRRSLGYKSEPQASAAEVGVQDRLISDQS
jgi:predicted MFS family arabinose efflux permease